MKTKLLCLLLTLLMLLPAAVACSNQTEVDINSNVDTTRSPVTLNMWIVTEEETTLEAQKAVEAAFNDITETDYTTHVNLIYCTEAEYKAALDNKFEEVDGRPAGTIFKPSNKVETMVDEEGMTVLKYPEAGKYQMDIVLILGKAMLEEYVAEGRLNALNDSLNGTFKTIRTYVYNDILNNSTINGNYYAVPNNNVIGKYTYLLVNKEMAEKYYFTASDFTAFGETDVKGQKLPVAKLIDAIGENEDLTKIAPLYGMAEYPLAKYWSEDGSASILATLYPNASTEIGFGVSVTNIFSQKNAEYRSFMREMVYCKEKGYLMDGQETFGVAVMEGDYTLPREYADDYYVSIIGYPRVDDADIFDSMFAVTNYTASLSRSMEIINALTCKSELRNVLQYGVEGVHYEIKDDGALVRKNDDPDNIYRMNINYTGNVLMAYPEEGMDLNAWQNVMLQNQQSMLSVTTGSNAYMGQVDTKAMAEMLSISRAYFDRLNRCETVAELETYLAAASTEIEGSSYYEKLSSIKMMVDDEGKDMHDPTSLHGALLNWWRTNYDPSFNAE